MTYRDLRHLPRTKDYARIAYGPGPEQFGELRLPAGKGPHPVIIVIHGGCWYSRFNLNYMGALASALSQAGSATWNLEYRRLGNGGGWPETFRDIAEGTDFVRVLAGRFPLDLQRTIVLGHSAGGQLALWTAGRRHLDVTSQLYTRNPLNIRGIVALAPISDPVGFQSECGGSTVRMLGGTSAQQPARYRDTSPLALLPYKSPVSVVHGESDKVVPLSMSLAFVAAANRQGGTANLRAIEGSGHFELVSPTSDAWPTVKSAVISLLGP